MSLVTSFFSTSLARFKLYSLVVAFLVATSARADIILPFPGFDPKGLGYSIDPKTGEISEPCVKGNSRLTRRPEIHMNLLMGESSVDLHRKVHGRISGGMNFGVFGHKKSVDFSNVFGSNEKQASLVLEVSYQHGNLKYSSDDMVADCLGFYVSQLNVGARLLIGIVIKFDSEHQLTRFVTESTYSAFWGAIKKRKRDAKEIKYLVSSAQIEARSILLGGASKELTQLGEKAECLPNQSEPCFEYFRKVLSIFKSPETFRKSVESLVRRDQFFVTSIVLQKHPTSKL